MWFLVFALSALAERPAHCNGQGELWAVIVAASSGFSNYRHQSDACAVYQLLHANGVPDDHIIVMMMDDIANNPRNKFPGKIFNNNGGPDVYHGVPKDYTGRENVTAAKLLAILDGTAPGKVLNSKECDNVWLYFVDHGGPGIFGMFDGKYLKKADLMDALDKLHTNKKYAELSIYIDACEAGSMLQDVPSDTNVLAVSATTPSQSGWGCCENSTIGAFLGEYFTTLGFVLYDTDKGVDNTLKDEYDFTYDAIKQKQQPCVYGDKAMQSDKIAQFRAKSSSLHRPTQPLDAARNKPVHSPYQSQLKLLLGEVSDMVQTPLSSMNHAELRRSIADAETQLKQLADSAELHQSLLRQVQLTPAEVASMDGDCSPSFKLDEACVEDVMAQAKKYGLNDFTMTAINTVKGLCYRRV